MAKETALDNTEKLLSTDESPSDNVLHLSDDDLSEVFGDAETSERGIETNDDLGLMEDFSLEERGDKAGRARLQSHNLELLMDVELNVVIELGRTRKTIRDVLRFGPGAVIELNKMAGETVDVLINDRLIAQGEVILFEDSLGVRITSIITPEQLIRQLGK
jgi:flagellar motor switch protein FliN